MSKATTDALANLHGILAADLARRIENGEASAADLAVARQFLKDNGIDADKGSNEGLNKLTDTLPTFDDDDGVVTPFAR